MTFPASERTGSDEALEHISAEATIWVRLAAICREDDFWHARLVELTSGAPPPSWDSLAWEYPRALFTGFAESGDVVGEWLRSSQIPWNDRNIKLPEMTTSVVWERRQSGAANPYEALHWPSVEASLARVDTSRGDPQGHLLSSGEAPSFINFYTAGASFFWFDRQPVGGSLSQGVVYRHQDQRGRINHVRIADEEIEVEVEGSGLDAMTIELAGEAPGHRQHIDKSRASSIRIARFSLENGLPPGAWVLLRTHDEWIDRRFLSVPWTSASEAGVEIVVEPRTKLESFLANREGPMVEFKVQIPTDDAAKLKVMKTVCAFANGLGGSVLFGIDDDHNPVGVPSRAVDRLRDQLTQAVGSWVEPRPIVTFDILPLGDIESVVLEMRVEHGTVLYGCARPGGVPTPYIRHYATSVKARPSEIERIVRSRTVEGLPAWIPGEARR